MPKLEFTLKILTIISRTLQLSIKEGLRVSPVGQSDQRGSDKRRTNTAAVSQAGGQHGQVFVQV